jgi:hypothetical protein
MSLLLGVNAKLYYLGSARSSWGLEGVDGVAVAAAPADLVEIAIVKDIEIPVEKEKADVSTRRSKYKATKGTLRGITIDIPMIYDLDDAGCLALQTAYLTGVVIPLAFLDGPQDTVGTRGLWADFEVTNMKKAEPLNGEQMVTYSVEPAYGDTPPEWVQVDAP